MSSGAHAQLSLLQLSGQPARSPAGARCGACAGEARRACLTGEL